VCHAKKLFTEEITGEKPLPLLGCFKGCRKTHKKTTKKQMTYICRSPKKSSYLIFFNFGVNFPLVFSAIKECRQLAKNDRPNNSNSLCRESASIYIDTDTAIPMPSCRCALCTIYEPTTTTSHDPSCSPLVKQPIKYPTAKKPGRAHQGPRPGALCSVPVGSRLSPSKGPLKKKQKKQGPTKNLAKSGLLGAMRVGCGHATAYGHPQLAAGSFFTS
jgi:hypothetical protein